MAIIVIMGGIITGKYGAAVVKLSVSASGVTLLCTTINELNKSGTYPAKATNNLNPFAVRRSSRPVLNHEFPSIHAGALSGARQTAFRQTWTV